MIRKFEEFVNEMYSTQTNIDYGKELVRFLDDEYGIYLPELKNIAREKKIEYTAEEAHDIIFRLPGCDTIEGIQNAVETLFFGTEDDLKEWCEMHDYSDCPVVMSIDGKLLTGKVYYSEALGAYAEDDDDFIEAGDEWLSIKASEEGILDDDQPDWVSDNWDMLEIYGVDLDKEFGWKGK